MGKAVQASRADSWLLAGARVSRGPFESQRLDIEIRSGRIAGMRPSLSVPPGGACLDVRGSLILPGLVNAHDHLEFNLFPRLGNGPYPSARAWALDIYHPDQSPVREQLGVPLECRLRWGALKNLLSGVTTVCHHNPFNPRIFSRHFPIRVPKRFGWAHSLDFSPDVRERFWRTPKDWPFILHLGEAVDRRGREEIQRLDALGALDHRTVLVHAVALDRRGLDLVRARGGSLVWCPSSNIFILGRTLSRAALESGIPVALGTDSALSGAGDLLEEMRLAREVRRVSDTRLFGMVTREAARVLRLRQGEGELSEGGVADLLVVEDSGQTPIEALLGLSTGAMEMVFVGGEVMLTSPRVKQRLPFAAVRDLQPLAVGSREGHQVFVALDISRIFQPVEPTLGPVVLAHRRMLRTA